MANFTCPYTGALQKVEFEMDTRVTAWVTRGGLDPSLPFFEVSEAVMAFTQRGGEPNRVKAPMCPYTGKPIEIVERNGLWYAEGDFFNPMAPDKDRNNLERNLTKRMGRFTKLTPARVVRPKIEVGETAEENSDPTEGLEGSSLDDTRHMIGEVIND